MDRLYKLIKDYSLKKAVETEQEDSQFLSLKELYHKIKDKQKYLSLIITNSIICYQLSSTGEKYWEEFSNYFINKLNNQQDTKSSSLFIGDRKDPEINSVGQNTGGKLIIKLIGDFIKQSKGNKRFVETKIKRLEKLKPFLEKFIGNEKYYYKNMLDLRNELAKTMNQKIEAKTIVFAVKMFSYGARNYFGYLEYFPKEIGIPIDSRLISIYEKYKESYEDINLFYEDLSKKLNIAPLHLDAILWVNYTKLIMKK